LRLLQESLQTFIPLVQKFSDYFVVLAKIDRSSFFGAKEILFRPFLGSTSFGEVLEEIPRLVFIDSEV
jgi:hypothetical protein